MNSKKLAKRLENMGYTLTRCVFDGWIVTSARTGFVWKFPTLAGADQFTVDNEATLKWMQSHKR